jgi:hypothetical protein
MFELPLIRYFDVEKFRHQNSGFFVRIKILVMSKGHIFNVSMCQKMALIVKKRPEKAHLKAPEILVTT